MIDTRMGALAWAFSGLAVATTVQAVTVPSGYIYSTQLLGNFTQSCVASAPGGTFVGIGPAFTANAQSIVLARESGDTRLVASGFNSIADCAYDAAADVLYVTDNADNDDFGIAGPFGAQSGDTVFAIPSASTASGLSAPGLELLPADSLAAAGSVSVDSSGSVLVADAAGGGLGSVVKITGTTPAPFLPGLDFPGGLAIDPVSGNVYLAEFLATFDNQVRQFTAAAVPVPPIPLAGPSFGFGSYDLAFDGDGQLLVTGVFSGDVVSMDPSTGVTTTFASGLTFATGVTVHPVTHRVEMLSSTFAALDEDKSLHRFTRIDGLVPGRGSPKTECVHEFYGVAAPDGKSAVCTDGAACDADGVVNDRCSFPVGFCFNVEDPNFADCDDANAVSSLRVTASPFSAGVADAVAGFAAQLPFAGSSCVFTDGIVVPVKIAGNGAKKDGKGKVRVKAETNAGQKDSDSIKLVCQPAP
jgi:hypothetical protein